MNVSHSLANNSDFREIFTLIGAPRLSQVKVLEKDCHYETISYEKEAIRCYYDFY